MLALVIFIIASISDFLDGRLARKYNADSKFGLFMDPLADKILVLAAFGGFLYLDILFNVVEPWMVFLIFFRDILVTALRLFMKKIGFHMLKSFNKRILNSHPSLLPKHGGTGMYGREIHKKVLAYKENLKQKVVQANTDLASHKYPFRVQ